MIPKSENIRDRILAEIRRLAELNEGQAPGSRAFKRDTGIGEKQWQGKYWARWTDVVLDAGLTPNLEPEKFTGTAILQKVAEAARHYGKMPTTMELRMYRNIDPACPTDRTISKTFRTKAALEEALKGWVTENVDFLDVTTFLPSEVQSDQEITGDQPKAGLVYLIRSGSYFKIGRSGELERRIKEIRVSLPEAATLVHAIQTDDAAGIENYWHRRFADRRANGEWFKLSNGDIAAFRRRKFQ